MIAHGEQVFPRVKEKCSSKDWFANEDINALEELIGRIRRLKENVGFIANRVTAIQAGLDSWQAEQINRKLYYLSFLSIIFLPLSIITGGQIISVVLSSNIYVILFVFDQRKPDINPISLFDSVWDECGRSSMDRTKGPRIKRWISQRNDGLCGYARDCSVMLSISSSL